MRKREPLARGQVELVLPLSMLCQMSSMPMTSPVYVILVDEYMILVMIYTHSNTTRSLAHTNTQPHITLSFRTTVDFVAPLYLLFSAIYVHFKMSNIF